MGRAFRVVKRTTHLTVEVTERPQIIRAVGTEEGGAAKPARRAAKSGAAKSGAKKTAKARKPAAAGKE
jgi:hypothetical protein